MTLGAQTAMISLFGPTHQYILAEASGTPLDRHCDSLLLGCCLLPKEKGICQDVAALPLSELSDGPAIAGGSVLVIPDIRDNRRFKQSKLADNLSGVRFYAGVPIVSPRGITIGSYCVMDKSPRKTGLDESSVLFMKDMAETVMEHLSMVQSKSRHHQTERMIVGLGSFVEGKATLQGSWLEANEQDTATRQSGEAVEGKLNKRQQDIQDVQDSPESQQLPHRSSAKVSSKPALSNTIRKDPDSEVKPTTTSATHSSSGTDSRLIPNQPNSDQASQQNKATLKSSVSIDDAPEEIVPSAFEKIFSRAANLIRESIEVEGVVFLDARVESFGELDQDEFQKAREAWAHGATTSGDESADSGSPPRPMHPFASGIGNKDITTCRMLGFSTSTSSSIDHGKPGHNYAMGDSLLKALLGRYPHGKIFNYNENGLLSDDSSGGNTSRSSEMNPGSERKKRRRKPHDTQNANALVKVLQGARSIIFLPLWDSHKARWLSGMFIWTKSPERVFTPEIELTYLRAFGNSVMAEIHRFDAEMAEKAKTDLLSNISHELRSPLHGILGTADILSDTAMNMLQQGMVHTIESCGRTLLDTINHLLDFTYMKKFKSDSGEAYANHEKQIDVPGLKPAKLQRNAPNSSERAYGPVQLDSVLEEVAESVFAGHSFYHHPRAQPQKVTNNESSMSISLPTKQVTIILDIQEAEEWAFLTSAGCWRRILMNVFGNALKYTPSGFIYVGLKTAPHNRRMSDSSAGSTASEGLDSQCLVTLTVKDTGQGISAEYLRDGLFTPFSQEDGLAPGSGLGLSIVRQALVSIGGSIEVSSEKGHGTEISIEVPLNVAPEKDKSDGASSNESYREIRKWAQGKTIGLLGFASSLVSPRDITLYKSLEHLCQDWFNLTVKRVSPSADNNDPCDFYMAVQTDLDSPDEEQNQVSDIGSIIDGKDCDVSPLIVICESPEKAHNMFARAANQKRESIIEYISQPCGPRKLAKALSLCILRLDGRDPEANKPTHWVEMPNSSKIPLDVGPRDPPNERMKLGKRPMLDTTGSSEEERLKYDHDDRIKSPTRIAEGAPPSIAAKDTVNDELSVLLVDDNQINLQILVAYAKKEGWNIMTATNGLEAVQTFRAHSGKFAAVIIGMQNSIYFNTF
jgi:signal transduction histidine kinase